MAGIQFTIVLGHPLAMTPPMQASAPVAPNAAVQWTTADRDDGQGPPGPVGPPVIS